MQKAMKPPPPVPPRPSKNLIKEALAKTKDMRKGPARMAPQPPILNGIVKSSSTYTVSPTPNPVPRLERSISEDANQGSRPIVYQSPNAKCVRNATINILKEENNINSCEEDSRSRSSTMEKRTISTSNGSSNSSSNSNSLDKKWDKMLNDRNHVNTLIDEMFASVLEVSSNCEENVKVSSKKNKEDENKIIINNRVSDEEEEINNVPTTVIIISDKEEENKSNSSTNERKVKFSDRMNHEYLIEELQHMKEDQDKIMKRQRKPSVDIFEENKINNDVLVNGCKMTENEETDIKLNTCHITIEDSNETFFDYERISKMSHLHGLPPLPKSLSGFGLGSGRPPPSPGRPQRRQEAPKCNASLDAQLAILRREMYSLRQQDLSLLSQLWSLNESIQDFRAILQDQDGPVGLGNSMPPPLSPAPSSGDEDEYYTTVGGGFRPPGGRRTSASSNASGSVG